MFSGEIKKKEISHKGARYTRISSILIILESFAPIREKILSDGKIVNSLSKAIFVLIVLLSFHYSFASGITQIDDTPGPSGWADSILKNMSVDEKIGQLFMIAAYSNRNEKYNNGLLYTIKKYRIGGVCFFQGGPVRQASLTNRIQKNASVPLLVAMDAEWGAAMRLDSVEKFPYAMTLGAVSDNKVIYNVAAHIAWQLKALGVQVAFGPDADINNNPANPVINYRSFGEDRNRVAEKAGAYMKGLQDNGILAVAKHFPGHGDTNTDSHTAMPVINHPLSYLDSVELYPFRQLINDGLQGIMAGHLWVPAINKDPEPVSLSQEAITGILRTRMGFNGLVFTDAMNMKAVTGRYLPGEAEVAAFKAGADIILMPDNLPAAVAALKIAIQKRKISIKDLNQRVKKILLTKQHYDLTSYNPIDLKRVSHIENEVLTRSVNQMAYEQAITDLGDSDNFLPVTILDTIRFASLSIGNNEPGLFPVMLSRYAKFDHFNLKEGNNDPEEYTELSQQLKKYNVIVAGIHSLTNSRRRDYGIDKNDLVFLRSLASHAKVIIVLFGIPYTSAYFSSFSHVICAYEDNQFTQRLVPQAIFGAIGFNGTLPVSAGDNWKAGSGVKTSPIGRLGYSYPELEGFNLDYLNYIDTIVTDAIRKKATPGCRVLVARNGNVIFDRSYGYFTYDSATTVKENSIYDLASVTKVSATLQAVMLLAERKIIDLDKKISVYLPELRNTNKENLIIRDLLTHQSGLRRYIPYWKYTVQTNKKKQYYYSAAESNIYPKKIAPGVFASRNLSDSVWSWVIESPLRDKKNELKPYDYRYSDIGFYILYEMVERITNQPLNEFLKQNIYDPLGLTTMTYLPANYFPTDSIVPSAIDRDFRNVLLQGYVQDQQAALFGGVAGHAGLFSDAHDLAVLMQMELQKGYYGGFQYFKPETIDEFTNRQYRLNRRGLGWDKPNSSDENLSPASGYVSSSSFGHTGFTGTMVWDDPGKNIVYVFLSNRTYPDMGNQKLNELEVRKRIQTVIYSALMKH